MRPAPEVAWETHRAREIAGIAESLRGVLRGLVAGNQPWPLFLSGHAGTGKSCAALCLLDWVVGGGWYLPVGTLCEWVIDAQHERLAFPWRPGKLLTVDTFWAQIHSSPLVVLDEIGAREKVSDHHYDCVKRVLDLRENKPLVCLSNFPLPELAKLYDDRICSRLAAGTCCVLTGKDQRLGR